MVVRSCKVKFPMSIREPFHAPAAPQFHPCCTISRRFNGGHAAELSPPLTDPELAEVFVQAKAALEKSASPGYMDMPRDAPPWPCPVTELQVRTWADVLGNDDYDDHTATTPHGYIWQHPAWPQLAFAAVAAEAETAV